ncbi:MAG TPA: EscU/YscU/HrcU family type III secretion system export apparatus switch protein [Bacillota bacterium]|nr:EscU/YscU/HrcU family type III secretion system export apparatus switch protein [Bacillota bacterium]
MNPPKRKKAVAITYEPNKNAAPVVSAKGVGMVADAILTRAKAHNVPIRENHSLVEILSKLNLNEQIPPELYQVVAEILAFVYRMENQVEKAYERQ